MIGRWKLGGVKNKPYKLLISTCYDGCVTGVAASRACIRIWEENLNGVKVADWMLQIERGLTEGLFRLLPANESHSDI